MVNLNKIVIHIKPENKNCPVYLSYDAGYGLQDTFNLNKETSNAAINLFKLVEKKKLPIKKNEIIYCYNLENKKIETLINVKEYNNCIFAGANLEGIKTLIRHIRYYAEKNDILALVYGECNDKTICLNESIINRKKGIKQEHIISDFENYLFLLEEYHKIEEKQRTQENKS